MLLSFLYFLYYFNHETLSPHIHRNIYCHSLILYLSNKQKFRRQKQKVYFRQIFRLQYEYTIGINPIKMSVMTDDIESIIPAATHNPLEQFVLLAKSAKGAACLDLIKQVLEAPGVHVFGELLVMPNVVEVRRLQP